MSFTNISTGGSVPQSTNGFLIPENTERRLDQLDRSMNGNLDHYKVVSAYSEKTGDNIDVNCERPSDRSKLDKFKDWIRHTFFNQQTDRDTYKKLASYEVAGIIRADIEDAFPHLADGFKDNLTDHVITNATLGKVSFSTDILTGDAIVKHNGRAHAMNADDITRANDMIHKYAKEGVPFTALSSVSSQDYLDTAITVDTGSFALQRMNLKDRV